jgi:hypothetical protein
MATPHLPSLLFPPRKEISYFAPKNPHIAVSEILILFFV